MGDLRQRCALQVPRLHVERHLHDRVHVWRRRRFDSDGRRRRCRRALSRRPRHGQGGRRRGRAAVRVFLHARAEQGVLAGHRRWRRRAKPQQWRRPNRPHGRQHDRVRRDRARRRGRRQVRRLKQRRFRRVRRRRRVAELPVQRRFKHRLRPRRLQRLWVFRREWKRRKLRPVAVPRNT